MNLKQNKNIEKSQSEMSITFQNSESIKQALIEELQMLLSSDQEVRQNAEVRMKHLEFTEGGYSDRK